MSSAAHIRSYCRRHQIPFDPETDGARKKSKTKVILTVVDHRNLVQEGILIVAIVNATGESKHAPFCVIGNP